MLRAMKHFLFVLALVTIVGCGAIQNADREVNKKTDHGNRGGAADSDGGASTSGGDAGKDAGITSL